MAKNSESRFDSSKQEQEKKLYFRAYTHNEKWSPDGGVTFNIIGVPNNKQTPITYSFDLAPYHHDTYGYCKPFGEEFRSYATRAMEQVAEFANITWRVESPEKARFLYQMCEYLGDDVAGQATFPADTTMNIQILSRYERTTEPNPDAEITRYYRPFTSLKRFVHFFAPDILDVPPVADHSHFKQEVVNHETGHSLALLHPHGRTLHREYVPLYTQDSSQMSYYSGNYTQGPSGYPPNTSHPMQEPPFNTHYALMDITTLQALYGSNTQFHAGNDVYAFDGTRGMRTIYDAGGYNSYDASSSSSCSKPDTVYMNANPDIHMPSKIGETAIFTAFSGPDEIIGGKWNNEIHGSYAHSNNINLSGAWGDQWIYSAGHNNVISLNPDGYGSAVLDYRSYSAPLTLGQDTVFGFSPSRDRIVISPDLLWEDIGITNTGHRNVTLPNGSVRLIDNGTTLHLGKNSIQTIILDRISPDAIRPSHFQTTIADDRNKHDYPNRCSYTNWEKAGLLFDRSKTALGSMPLQISIGAGVAFKEEGFLMAAMIAKLVVSMFRRGRPLEATSEQPVAVDNIPEVPSKTLTTFVGNLLWDGVAIATRIALPVASLTHDVMRSMKEDFRKNDAASASSNVPDLEGGPSNNDQSERLKQVKAFGRGVLGGLKIGTAYVFGSSIYDLPIYAFWAGKDFNKGGNEPFYNSFTDHGTWHRPQQELFSAIISRTRGLRHVPDALDKIATWRANSHTAAEINPAEYELQPLNFLEEGASSIHEEKSLETVSPNYSRVNNGKNIRPLRTRSFSEDVKQTSFVQQVAQNRQTSSHSF